MDNPLPFQYRSYLMMSVDPLRVGAGESQDGPVDLPIVRDAGSNLPIVPATTIRGALRSLISLGASRDRNASQASGTCAANPSLKPCGRADCLVCLCFGRARAEDRDLPSLLQIFDARVLFFPVFTALGPMWLTCPQALRSLVVSEVLKSSDLRIDVSSDTPAFRAMLPRITSISAGWPCP